MVDLEVEDLFSDLRERLDEMQEAMEDDNFPEVMMLYAQFDKEFRNLIKIIGKRL